MQKYNSKSIDAEHISSLLIFENKTYSVKMWRKKLIFSCPCGSDWKNLVVQRVYDCVYETISYLPTKSDGSIKEQPNIYKSKRLSFCNNSNLIQNCDTDGGIYLILSGNVFNSIQFNLFRVR